MPASCSLVRFRVSERTDEVNLGGLNHSSSATGVSKDPLPPLGQEEQASYRLKDKLGELSFLVRTSEDRSQQEFLHDPGYGWEWG